MFTFLKNRIISSTIAVATTVGGAGSGEKLAQQQKQFSSNITADYRVDKDSHNSTASHFSNRLASKLMDEDYFLRKFEEYEKNDTWDYIFQRINLASDTQAKELSLCCDHSNNFHEKNRYRNVLPYDQNRITLKNVANEKDSYINASPLHLPFARRNYILTQGPLPNTASDFWQMIYEQKASICIMLSKVMEKSFIKCHSYFPSKEVNKLKFEHFECELEHEEQKPNYIIRRIRLTPLENFLRIDQQKPGNSTISSSAAIAETPSDAIDKQLGGRIIHHFQFTTWPDFGVPEHTDHFLEFLEEVRATREKLLEHQNSINNEADVNPPVVCHCSAGIGRTGTFVIVDSVVSMIEKKRQQKMQESTTLSSGEPANDRQVEEQLVSLEALVIYIRRHRMGLIQTSQQLRFCWKTIVDWIKKSSINSNLTSTLEIQRQHQTPSPLSGSNHSPQSPASAVASPSVHSPSSPWVQPDQSGDQSTNEDQPPPKSAIVTDIRWCVGSKSAPSSPGPNIALNSSADGRSLASKNGGGGSDDCDPPNGNNNPTTTAGKTAAATARS